MRPVKILTFATASLIVVLTTGGTAVAQEFVCKDVVFTREMAGASDLAKMSLSKQTTLHLTIDKDEPGRSTLRWNGDPKMEGTTSTLPADSKIIVEHGTIATSFAASRDGISSVGTATLDSKGELRITESTLTQPGVLIFDVLEAKCRESRE